MTYTVSGVLASEPDQRDYIYIPKTRSFPRQFSRRQFIVDYEDQESIGACVANGGTSTLETHANHFGQVVDLSRMFIYGAGRFLEGRLGEEGMYVRTLYKVLQKYGVPLEEDYPYDISKKDLNPPVEAYALAATRKIGRYEFVVASNSTFGTFEPQQKIDRIKAALLEGLIPTIAFQVTQSIFSLSGRWQTHNYALSTHSPLIGGHLMYVIGWDDDAGKFEVVNSWGQSWGDLSIGGFPYGIVSEPFFESWIAREFMGLVVPEEPGIKLEYQNRYSIGFRIVPKPGEVGQSRLVWIGAKLPDGRLFLRTSVNDTWALYSGGAFTPAFSHVLAEDNPLKAVNWMWNLSDFAGAKVYVGYGTSPMDMVPTLICTV